MAKSEDQVLKTVHTERRTSTKVGTSFRKLKGSADPRRATGIIGDLDNEFDALLDRMQMPKARAGMKAAFDASPADLGWAAVEAARKRE